MRTLKWISFCVCMTLFCSKSFAIYLLVADGELPHALKKRAYHEVLVKEDYPACLVHSTYFPSPQGMTDKLKRIHPQFAAKWVPTTLFQLFVVHAYFFDSEFQEFVRELGYGLEFYDKENIEEKKKFEAFKKNGGAMWELNIDQQVIQTLSDPQKSIGDLFSLYAKINHKEAFCSFFLKMNEAFLQKYLGTDLKGNCLLMVDQLLKEIPCDLQSWKKEGFPFCFNAFARENMELLLALFEKNPQVIRTVIDEEIKAHAEEKHLVYRGAECIFFPSSEDSTLPLLFFPLKGEKSNGHLHFRTASKEQSSFSLSYSNSFFGGLFFSLDACAARYSQSLDRNYVFHALALDRKVLLEDPLFCIPPLHPFAEMFSDGEWFHPHTKTALNPKDARCHGWYAKVNHTFIDHLEFLTRHDHSSEKLAAKLLRYAAQNAIILRVSPKDFSLNLKNHEKPAEALTTHLSPLSSSQAERR